MLHEDAGATSPREPMARVPLWQDTTAAPTARVDSLLMEMTLEEKLAQLGSRWLGFRGANTGNVAPMQDTFAAVDVPFEQAREHGLGHITRVFGTAPISVSDGIARVVELQDDIIENTRLRLPAIVHEECLTGFATLGATVYPAPIACAATFDPDLVERMAAAIGSDLRAVGVQQGLAPVLDVVRDYRWGRVEETYGEDPYLVGTMGTAFVRGLETQGIVATLKHFAGYSASRAARNHAPVSMGPRELRDVILPPFERAIREGGARSVMNSYADVDGVPAAADHALLTSILREDWGFEGVVVSDYWSVPFLRSMHGVASTLDEAGALALAAGIDVELPDTICFGSALRDRVRAGLIPETAVDRAARRVLNQKLQLGMLDPDWRASDQVPGEAGVQLDSARNRALARELAERSVVLLANRDRVLPLRREPGATLAIALVGPGADDPLTFMGCYSYPNHILHDFPELGLGVEAPSLWDALRKELPDYKITLSPGAPIMDEDRSGFEAATAAAAAADLCVAVVGDRAGLFGRGTSGEGCDAADLALPGVQAELLDQLLATATPLVLVVVSGRPYALGPYADRCAAIIQSFMPGEEGGGAIAGVLSGRVIPTGKLPVQIPRDRGIQPSTYLQPRLGANTQGVSNLDPTALFPFGHGESYTTYEYDNVTVSDSEVPTDGQFTVSFDLRNTGARAGEEICQLYLHHDRTEVVQPLVQLSGFARVPLATGQIARVSFSVHADLSAYTGLDLQRYVDPGELKIMVGPSAANLPLVKTVRMTGERRTVGHHERVLSAPAHVENLPE